MLPGFTRTSIPSLCAHVSLVQLMASSEPLERLVTRSVFMVCQPQHSSGLLASPSPHLQWCTRCRMILIWRTSSSERSRQWRRDFGRAAGTSLLQRKSLAITYGRGSIVPYSGSTLAQSKRSERPHRRNVCATCSIQVGWLPLEQPPWALQRWQQVAPLQRQPCQIRSLVPTAWVWLDRSRHSRLIAVWTSLRGRSLCVQGAEVLMLELLWMVTLLQLLRIRQHQRERLLPLSWVHPCWD
mmetsp:Transcript_5746/g.10984  ORF Transcript_5746/g.10984 Transcript_5746/m.10984 type:complete len:240 (-) Transcript_5746:409-1128(-)